MVSNFGSRVDCYGWGEQIVTAGYGDLDPGTGDNSTYTDTFGGTSGASPMVVGAALVVQGAYEAATGTRLSPGQMRFLLGNPATGTPQGGGVAGNIGVMPDLQAILQNALGLVPDVYVRDAVGDTGAVPHAGAISASPDVIVLPTAVPDPTASFGEGSGTEDSSTLGIQAEAGQDNFIYVRMRNRGGAQANADARVFWSEVATLVTPDTWTEIGTAGPVNVPVGDTLVVAGPVVWPAADVPGTGHYCFVALLDGLQDAAPSIPPATDWDGFRALIRNHNNVTWRNFNVVDVSPDPNADPAALSFAVTGPKDRSRWFDLELHQRLPEDVRVWWEMPIALLGRISQRGFVDVKVNRNRGMARLLLPRTRALRVCGVRLGPRSRHRCQFLVQGGAGLQRGWHTLAIRQLFEDEEVGRVTFAIRAAEGGRRRRRAAAKKSAGV